MGGKVTGRRDSGSEWLRLALEETDFDNPAAALTSWEAAQSTGIAHPREEHLLRSCRRRGFGRPAALPADAG